MRNYPKKALKMVKRYAGKAMTLPARMLKGGKKVDEALKEIGY